ncbi:hypothetical protein [Methanoculleus bourgensis]|uniref:hypothetical protein n=1 Tax=Methanoculleus bourgensis TaxID=83986 RepID=UPI000781F68C|nr:hypothetical protein [Methanoculleus bourgensis]
MAGGPILDPDGAAVAFHGDLHQVKAETFADLPLLLFIPMEDRLFLVARHPRAVSSTETRMNLPSSSVRIAIRIPGPPNLIASSIRFAQPSGRESSAPA